jgi:hypothetical protein
MSRKLGNVYVAVEWWVLTVMYLGFAKKRRDGREGASSNSAWRGSLGHSIHYGGP